MNRLPVKVAEFVNEYDERRVIHRRPNGQMHVKRMKSGVSQDLGRVVSMFVGQRVREERQKLKLTLESLARRSGMSPSKMRMRDIEKAMNGGPKLGTVYALAAALGVSVASLLPDVYVAMKESGVSMVGDMQLYTREEVDRMLRAIGGPVSVANRKVK